MRNLIVLSILGLAAWGGYRHFNAPEPPDPAPIAATAAPDPAALREPPPPPSPRFTCDGRTHCSQMRSCEEAMYFLQHCPNTEMDGNGDGVPCERQWCG